MGTLSPTETQIIVVRHGETEWNKEGRLQGQHDTPLNSLGIQQASKLAEYLALQKLGKIDAIYTSDLCRTHKTACIIAEAIGLEDQVVKDKAFREKHLGVMQGLTLKEAQQKEPDAFNKWMKGKPVPGAEERESVIKRVIGGLNAIAGKHKGERVLVITHGGIKNSIHRYMQNGQKYPGKIPNTSYSVIKKDADTGQWNIIGFACCDHLQGTGVGYDTNLIKGSDNAV